MPTISGCTIVRNGVLLNYPLEASIRSYYDICNEVIVAYDPSEDGTEALVESICKKFPRVRGVKSYWDMTNHVDGTEITIQSNVAIRECVSDWILYVQADEAIHEDDHSAIKNAIESRDCAGVLFDRKSFLYTLDQEIPEYFAANLLRLFRNGEGYAVGDAMTCGLVQGVSGRVYSNGLRMFNYSRMGGREEILKRCQYRDNFHHDSESDVARNSAKEFLQNTKPFDFQLHPSSIKECYASFARSRCKRSLVSLGVLLGQREHAEILPFLEQFRDWPGDIVVVDDTKGDGGRDVFQSIARRILPNISVSIVDANISGGFGEARNTLHAHAAPWIMHVDLDERFDRILVANVSQLIAQLDRDGAEACGLSRANYLNGVLINDLPSTKWSEKDIQDWLPIAVWPPQNRDVQIRLVRRECQWSGVVHEKPTVEKVVVLRDHWINHNKSLDRQRVQDARYRSMGQPISMPL